MRVSEKENIRGNFIKFLDGLKKAKIDSAQIHWKTMAIDICNSMNSNRESEANRESFFKALDYLSDINMPGEHWKAILKQICLSMSPDKIRDLKGGAFSTAREDFKIFSCSECGGNLFKMKRNGKTEWVCFNEKQHKLLGQKVVELY